MLIYADMVFLENLVINFVIIYITMRLKQIKIRIIRILLSAAIGGISAIVSVYINGIISIVFKLVISIILMEIVMPTLILKELFENTIIFYFVSILMGGSSFALSYILKGFTASINEGLIIEFPILLSVIGTIVGTFLIIYVIKKIRLKISKRNLIYNIDIVIAKKNIRAKALLDTGNMLKDPFTDKPVIIVSRSIAKKILNEEEYENILIIMGGDKIGELKNSNIKNRIIIIPFNSLGNEHGILIGIKSDKIIVNDIKLKNIIIGLYEKELSKKGKYNALIGLDLLN